MNEFLLFFALAFVTCAIGAAFIARRRRPPFVATLVEIMGDSIGIALLFSVFLKWPELSFWKLATIVAFFSLFTTSAAWWADRMRARWTASAAKSGKH